MFWLKWPTPPRPAEVSEHVCDECGKSFGRSSSLTAHKIMAHDAARQMVPLLNAVKPKKRKQRAKQQSAKMERRNSNSSYSR